MLRFCLFLLAFLISSVSVSAAADLSKNQLALQAYLKQSYDKMSRQHFIDLLGNPDFCSASNGKVICQLEDPNFRPSDQCVVIMLRVISPVSSDSVSRTVFAFSCHRIVR